MMIDINFATFQKMVEVAATFTSQAQQLTELQADLGISVGKMMDNVQIMIHTSSQMAST